MLHVAQGRETASLGGYFDSPNRKEKEDVEACAWTWHSPYIKAVRNRGHFSSDEAALKAICLLLVSLMDKWTMPIRDWTSAGIEFANMFEEDFESSV